MTRLGPGMPATSPEGQLLRGRSLAIRYLNFVKLPHTLFALLFALVGVVAASRVAHVRGRTILLVVIAFTAARWVAMGFNRVVDRHYDSLNPRTSMRELPHRALSLGQAWGSIAIAAFLFLGCAALLNPLSRMLGPLALAWVMTYSFTKRFT